MKLLKLYLASALSYFANSAVILQTDTQVATDSAEVVGCNDTALAFHLSDPPYENYFYSNCHSAAQVVVTSPISDSNLTIIGPRLLIAWPAGNSGIATFFAPQNGINGTLGIELKNITDGQSLQPVYTPQAGRNPSVGITGLVEFNSSSILTVAILGSIRTIRDFTEGPSLLYDFVENATHISQDSTGKTTISRIWLDNVTETTLSFLPAGPGQITLNGLRLNFDAGVYNFTASLDYPQLTPLTTKQVLNTKSQDLITQDPDQTQSLAFLSYSTKLLAGAWRFLTYFGRDSMISLLLLQPVLSEGEDSAIEAVIGAVLERINRTDGSVCHEETIGDYATYLNSKQNITSSDPQCDYKMIDSDYYLPIVMQNYFVKSVKGAARKDMFLMTNVTEIPDNIGLTYGELALITAEKIMNTSAPFAATGGQIKSNLIHLKDGQTVGEWRDSNIGIGGGRIPYDVNTALVPAALRAIADLSSNGFFSEHPDWKTTAAQYAKVWEDRTLDFFKINVAESEAKTLVQTYLTDTSLQGTANVDNITSDVTFYGLALDGYMNQSIVRVMNTDDCFRHFLLNTTDDEQLSSFLSQSAEHILQPFPIGLSTPIGLLVANPAYGGDEAYTMNFTNNAYHGTVVWSWQLAMMGAGLERQLDRCTLAMAPKFCSDSSLRTKVLAAYNHLWEVIEANKKQLGSEVWSWIYENGTYRVTPLGSLPPPPGSNPTESDIRQLWSLTFLAVTRNINLK